MPLSQIKVQKGIFFRYREIITSAKLLFKGLYEHECFKAGEGKSGIDFNDRPSLLTVPVRYKEEFKAAISAFLHGFQSLSREAGDQTVS